MLNIRALRIKAGISQRELADRLDLAPASVCQWESGETMPSPHRMPMIASVLGCSISDIFGEEVPHADTDGEEI